MALPAVTLRPTSASDQHLLLQVYAATRAAELALTGWNQSACEAFVLMQFNAQTSHYRQQWPASDQAVIEVETEGAKQAVGRLWVDRQAGEILVLDIAILPDWCSRGVGTTCLRRLMGECAQGGQALTIQVEQGNPARRLYERLGFQPVGPQHGLHQLMAWRHVVGAISPREEACYEQA